MSKKFDISKLSVKELRELETEIARTIKKKIEEEKAALLKQMKELAEKSGFTFSELIGEKISRRSQVSPKYRNPNDRTQTWSGRGKRPKWIQEYIDQGGKIEDLLIKK